jgi:signal transduction histidine kinase
VRREAGARGDEVLLEVLDSGCGIPPEHLDRIFEPFRSTFDKGTGLGMAIVHRIVSDHGGTIDVSSTVGEGTLVRVRLPLAGVPRAATRARPTEEVLAI